MNNQDNQRLLPVFITLILVEACLFAFFYMLALASTANRGGSSDVYFDVLLAFAAFLPMMNIIAWYMHVKSSIIVISTLVISFLFILLHILILG